MRYYEYNEYFFAHKIYKTLKSQKYLDKIESNLFFYENPAMCDLDLGGEGSIQVAN